MPDENGFLTQNEIDDILARGGHSPQPEADRPMQIPAVIGCDSGWIKCSDRLPKKREIVDVWKNNQYCIYKRVENILFDGEWFCDLISHYGRDEITHWMPRPEPTNHGR